MVYPLLVAGKEIFTKKTFDVRSPYDGTLVGKVSSAGDEEITLALTSAQIAFDISKSLCAKHREDILLTARDLLVKRAEEFAKSIVLETGKTIREAEEEVKRGKETLALSALLTREPLGEVIQFDSAPNGENVWGFYQRFPAGPVLAITPFNFPVNLALHKIGPAVAVGNPFILKPSSRTPITALVLGKLFLDAGMPPEGVSVLPGDGAIVGEKLAIDSRIKVVTFTGSPAVGKRLASCAGMKNIALELGSNSAAIVMPDADIMWSADRILKGAMALAGQVCISVQRVYAHKQIFDQLVDLIVSYAKQLKIGDPMDRKTDIGPMISHADVERILNWLDEAVSQGSQIVCGGKSEGNFLYPTVVINVPKKCNLMRKEAFAPVLVINPISNIYEAIELVNDSEYGLQVGVFTRDIHYARASFEKIDVGGVIINDVPTFRADIMPYGGVKDSGLGREGPKYALEHMTYIKTFAVRKELL